MKSKTLILIGILVTIFACNSDDDNNSQQILNLDGEYIGIFERNGNTSNVELNFDNGSFIGESDTELYPAICNGTYSVSNDIILFENLCGWYANFDWTLILSDNWTYELSGQTLTMIKANGDKYTLTKQ